MFLCIMSAQEASSHRTAQAHQDLALPRKTSREKQVLRSPLCAPPPGTLLRTPRLPFSEPGVGVG